MAGKRGMNADWDRVVRMQPTPEKVAALAATHGYIVCCQRWSWVNPRVISYLLAEGRKELEAA